MVVAVVGVVVAAAAVLSPAAAGGLGREGTCRCRTAAPRRIVFQICGDGGAEPVDNALVDEYPLWISTDRGEIHDGSHCQGYQCKLPMDDGEQLARRDQE